MFKISHYNEQPGSIAISVQFKFLERETIEVSKTFATKREAMAFYGEMATDFLRGQIDEFTKIVKFIHPHYFDSSKVPFMKLGNIWRESYHPFLYSALMKLSDLYNRPGEYTAAVLHYRQLFKNLIPTMDDLGKNEMTILFNDIMQTAGKIIELMDQLKQIDNPNKKAV